MEAVQELILKTLELKGVIEDTRQLVLPDESSPAVSQDAQLTILGALNSLSSRDVSRIYATDFHSILQQWSDYFL